MSNYDAFLKVEPINKGWSSDKKYYVETKDGQRLLIRISDVSEHDEKKKEFDIMKQLASTGIKMSQPIEFGICNDGKSSYQVLTWIDGEEAKDMLPFLTDKEQYSLGWEAGQMMLKMQKAESYPASDNWSKIYSERVANYIKEYKACGQNLYGEELLLAFLEEHSLCLKNRPMCLLHADFQSDNMVISPNKRTTINTVAKAYKTIFVYKISKS